ncbi:PREDICTED: uncharacterized protein LOC109174342 [Ipomoea nil]|uniref:uncharacterized protein LOC109174342 n=1 Tax=Ipomoea nil TaxID=35883 RepID=UPI000900AC16|nr:PREDICTED: uncharacterized protein LOC109174342 [Ipomoea nil]
MRGRSSKQVNEVGLEVEKLKEEPHVSGAYIRTLVKQLTCSRTKDPVDGLVGDGEISCQNRNSAKPGDSYNTETQQQQQQQQQPRHKKQVRRRLHTSRPYQERLLNMAEARREIVTALKFHRAAMEQQKQQQLGIELLQTTSPQTPLEQQEEKLKSRRNPRTYASNPTTSNSFPILSCPPPPHQYPYSYPISSVAPPLTQESLNFPLPNQTLGLNLNLHDFNNNLDTTPYFTNNNPSYFPIEDIHCPMVEEGGYKVNTAGLINDDPDSGLHPVIMDDKEKMAEMRSIGEQHQMEWNDTLNFVTSAWWFKFFKTMEIGPAEDQDYGCYPFHEVMEFPAWLNANESCFSDTYSHGFLQDPGLPCMDIEEIEGMDVEWLA